MKAERRHELKESDLAHALERGGQYLKQNGGRIGLLIVVVIAAVVVGNVVIQARENAVASNWQARLDTSLVGAPAEDVPKRMETLISLASESTDPEFAMSTLVEVGREGLRLAIAENETPDKKLLDLSRQAFERLLADYAGSPVSRGAAHFGLAAIEENEFSLDGDIKHKTRAREHLQAILDDKAMHNLPYYQQALARMERFDEIFTQVVFAPPALPQMQKAEPPAGDDNMAKPIDLRQIDPSELPAEIREQLQNSGQGQGFKIQPKFEPAQTDEAEADTESEEDGGVDEETPPPSDE